MLAQLDEPNAVVETNEMNNVISTPVPYSAAVDLVAQAVVAPPLVGPGDPIAVDVQFTNAGFAPAGVVDVKLWASLDAQLTPDDRLLTQTTVSVAGGQQVAQPLSFVMPAGLRADDYVVLLQLDDGPAPGSVVEVSDGNNVVASAARLQVRQADLVVGDLKVRAATAPFAETRKAFFGEPLRLEALVQNAGGARATNVRVAFYLSDNETLNALNDPLVGEVTGLTLQAGEAQWVTLPAGLVPTQSNAHVPLLPQDYFLFAAAVAPGLAELNALNNTFRSAPTLVIAPGPNLVALGVRAPTRLGAGEVVAVSRTLANVGNRSASVAQYRYFLSANDIITTEDVPLLIVTSSGEVSSLPVTLGEGQVDSAVDLVRAPANVTAASWSVGVLIDPDNTIDETDETDNGAASSPSVVVSQGLALATPSLPDALVGKPYLAQLTATEPATFALADAAELPSGLGLTPAGLLSGTPTNSGLSAITFVVSSSGRQAVGRRTLRVASATTTLALTSTALPPAVVQRPYDAVLGAAGGMAPYEFTLARGALPDGVTLEPSGRLQGVVAAAAGRVASFVVRVTDLLGNRDERAFSLTVSDETPLTLQTSRVAEGVVGVEYVQELLATGVGGGLVEWAVVGGALPRGLTLEPSTSARVVISGTPLRAGSWSFAVEASDGGRRDTASYVLVVLPRGAALTGELPSVVAPGEVVSASLALEPPVPEAIIFVESGRLPAGLAITEVGLAGTVSTDAPLERSTFTLAARVGDGPSFALRPAAITIGATGTAAGRGCSSSGAAWPEVLLALSAMRWRARARRW